MPNNYPLSFTAANLLPRQTAALAAIHDRCVETDTGYKIILGRGLDIFQHYNRNDAFNLAVSLQEERACKAFEVTILAV